MTANPEKGEVELTIGDRVYVLTLKTRGLIALQKHFSTPDKRADLADIFVEAESGSLEHGIAIVWAAFLKYHPDVTFDQAVDLIDEAGSLLAISEQIAQLSQSMVPDQEDVQALGDDVKRPLKAQRRGTGARSTSRPVAVA